MTHWHILEPEGIHTVSIPNIHNAIVCRLLYQLICTTANYTAYNTLDWALEQVVSFSWLKVYHLCSMRSTCQMCTLQNFTLFVNNKNYFCVNLCKCMSECDCVVTMVLYYVRNGIYSGENRI